MSSDIEFNKNNYTGSEMTDSGKSNSGKSRKLLSMRKSKSVKTNENTRINLSELPSELADKLRHLDLTNDGYIDAEDILVLDEEEKRQEKLVKIVIEDMLNYINILGDSIWSNFYRSFNCFLTSNLCCICCFFCCNQSIQRFSGNQ